MPLGSLQLVSLPVKLACAAVTHNVRVGSANELNAKAVGVACASVESPPCMTRYSTCTTPPGPESPVVRLIDHYRYRLRELPVFTSSVLNLDFWGT